MTRAFVGLGSNLGDREATILRALGRLQEEPEVVVVRVSSLRETEPVGYVDQPQFLNGVVELETDPVGYVDQPRFLNGVVELETDLPAA